MNTLARLCLLVLCALPALSVAAPFGYSVNSDQSPGDQLHLIDLETGQSTVRGQVFTGANENRDVEGLAFDREGTLWAVDEWEFTLFPIEPVNGVGDANRDQPIDGLEFTAGNDFGMTFTCEDELFISSVVSQKLYRLDTGTGLATEVGSLGARIAALAAWGKPARLYGLGVGQYGDPPVTGSRSLYLIDTGTGAATPVGQPLGDAVAPYFEGGLSFDDSGQLWAITDRHTFASPLGSQVLRLNQDTGAATLVSTTVASGFESLAISGPGGCEAPPVAEPGELNSIPTFDHAGRALAMLLLLLTGLAVLQRRLLR